MVSERERDEPERETTKQSSPGDASFDDTTPEGASAREGSSPSTDAAVAPKDTAATDASPARDSASAPDGDGSTSHPDARAAPDDGADAASAAERAPAAEPSPKETAAPEGTAEPETSPAPDRAATTGASDEKARPATSGTATGSSGARKGPRAPQRQAGRRERRRSRLVTLLTVFGELLITAGLVLALFVVYSLWWTNVEANREARRQSDQVRQQWRERGPGGPERPSELDVADGIGFLHVPSMSDEPILVKKGTDPEKLNDGIAGVYQKPVKAALPWERSGNFSLAAHRDGHGAKFHNIHKIKVGDPMVFETRNTWYVYRAYATLPKTSKYNVDVLDPIPKESGKKEKGRYLTLTTCTPIFTSEHRYVVWGELVRTEDVDAERTPPKELR